MSDIDTAVVDSLKALDPKRPIREADMGHRDARKSRVRARYPRVATAGGSPSLNFTPTEKILMLAFEVPV